MDSDSRRHEWLDMNSAPRDGSHFLATCEVRAVELDEHDRIIDQIVERYAVVAYFCFGAFVHFPFNGGIPTNVSYLGWQPLPDLMPVKPRGNR